MKIADLFIDLTLQGTGKVAQSLSSVKGFLTDVSASGIAAKVAIAGTLAALERLTASAGKFGNAVTNQSLLTGLSTTTIQQWGEYMRKSGGDAEDAASSLQAAQNILTSIKRGEGVPAGVSAISRDTHTNILEHLDDPAFVAEKVRQYIRTTKDAIGLANANAQSLGITPGAIAAFRKNGEDITAITENIASPTTIKKLDRTYQAWSNFWKQLETLRNVGVANFGLPIIENLDGALKMIIKLGSALDEIIKKSHLFKGLGEVMKLAFIPLLAIFSPITAAITGIIFLLGEWSKHAKNKESIFGDKNFKGNALEGVIGAFKGGPNGEESKASSFLRGKLWDFFGAPPAPTPVQPQGAPTTNQQNTNINIHQHGVKDTHASVDHFKDEISRAYHSVSTLGTVA